MSAKLHNLVQIAETSNQTLDRIIAREVVKEFGSIVPSKGTLVIKGLSDIVPEDSPNKLPPMRDIPHAIEPD